jgi:hypothetical protein
LGGYYTQLQTTSVPQLVSSCFAPTVVSANGHSYASRFMAQMSHSARLFHRFLCRVGTLPAGIAEEFSSPRCNAALKELDDVERMILARRDRVSTLLHNAVGITNDVPLRRSLISARRSLFNAKVPSSVETEALHELSSPEAIEATKEYLQLMEMRDESLRKAQDAFTEERELSRARLSQFTRDKSVQRGLLLSSLSLFRTQEKYHEHRPLGDLTGKYARMERGLLRYLLRTVMKATPYGTFCAVLPGLFETGEKRPVDGAIVCLDGDMSALRTSTRLNKALCGVFTQALSTLPSVRSRFLVELNSSIESDDRRYMFLAVVDGREVFQTVERAPILDIIVEFVRAKPDTNLGALVHHISHHPNIECTQEEAQTFSDQLLKVGIMTLRTGIRQQDPDWDYALTGIIAGIEEEAVTKVGRTLQELRAVLDRAMSSPLDEWSGPVERVTANLSETFAAFGLKDETGGPFREDATANVVATVAVGSGLASVERDICRLVETTRPIALPRIEQASMRHFFDMRYDSAKAAVPFLRFYEDYFRGHLKEHLEKRRAAQRGEKGEEVAYPTNNPFGLPFVDAVLKAHDAITNLILERCQQSPLAEEVNIAFSEIESIVRDIPSPASLPSSVAMFGILAREPGAECHRFITKGLGYSSGYGRFFSRWLHMLPTDFRETILASNKTIPNINLAEISSDGNHNANLHPPLVEWEIAYPGSECGPKKTRIRPTDLVVTVDRDDPHALSLTLANGHRVLPLDLGFLALEARPPLYQLLSAFAPPYGFGIGLPAGLGAEVPDPSGSDMGLSGAAHGETLNDTKKEPISYRPRIVLGTLVITRRAWSIPRSKAPIPEKGESDFSFYRRVRRWRSSYCLPSQAYMRLERHQGKAPDLPAPEGQQAGATEEEVGSVTPEVWRSMVNDFKPQYIDFDSPLMVGLFRAALDRPPGHSLLLVERYPTYDMLPAIGEDRYSAEQVIQVELR